MVFPSELNQQTVVVVYIKLSMQNAESELVYHLL